ncbi:radical SAM family heme chaperone HemW [Jannaschia ovalis]|uniref:Heme chaperone HemW n=1 Tax=Jannaschia ovalis TaxID=3038773 RepID=A0ABY8LIR7_9RHOB|nr:radical SAM family heme chaperone HemW [Jannaschia sp. GRR-S6-38]WGH80298.1 radical SAM family heme chaperone HemW [Jannaschia sp. GRR-S6-38]
MTALEPWQEGGFGLYLHWPFCAAKCPYCDFNSHVSRRIDQDEWLAAYLRDLEHWAERTPGRVLSSVFFGGGTPSLMEPRIVGAILDRVAALWTPANDIEITLEANPTSVEADRFAGFVGAGVNRFSVGLQALNDPDLRALGRLHSAAEGRRAVDIARSVCDRVSFDLIYARQNQSLADWEAELREALSFAGEHLSLYQLTIEAGTAFGDRFRAGRLRGLPSDDLSAEMFELTQALCAEAGLPRYEVSNHAVPGAESRHNLIYWRGGDWLGIGPGAHGRIARNGSRVATEATRMPTAWLEHVAERGTGTAETEDLQTTDIAEEYLIMGLRMRDGIDLDRLRRMGGHVDAAALEDLTAAKLLERDGARLRASESGVLLLNRILAELAPV